MRTPQRQHLSLSYEAYEVIRSDMIIWNKNDNFSGFLNKIFLNSYETSPASIRFAVEHKRTELISTLKEEKYRSEHPYDLTLKDFDPSISLDESDFRTIELFLSSYKRQLLAQMSSFPNDISRKFRLQNQVFDILNPFEPDHCPEAEYYRSRAGYLKAVIENYARKTPYERESIYYRNILDTLEQTIHLPKTEKRILQIKHANNRGSHNIFYVKVYKIMHDTESDFHYLVGLSKPKNAHENAYQPAVFRISRILDITILQKSFGSGKITQIEEKNLTEHIQKRGLQFLIQDVERIVISLTPAGWNMYHSIQHLRPNASKHELDASGNNILYFDCTRLQIFYYFFKFGKEAVILEPPEMKEDFRIRYEQALKVYEKRN